MGTFACGDVKRRWHTQQRALDLLVYITNNFVLSRAHVLCECISHILYAADVKSQSGIMLPLVHIQKTDYHSLFSHVRGCIREFPCAGAAYVAGWLVRVFLKISSAMPRYSSVHLNKIPSNSQQRVVRWNLQAPPRRQASDLAKTRKPFT